MMASITSHHITAPPSLIKHSDLIAWERQHICGLADITILGIQFPDLLIGANADV